MLLVLISTAGLVQAQGEHSRRAAAELQVILGDIRKLQTLNSLGQAPLQVTGLSDRIKGGFSGLDLLMRLADQENGQPAISYTRRIAITLNLIEKKQWTAAEAETKVLANRFTLLIPAINPTRRSIEKAQKIHTTLCAACHDNPVLSVERPAYNLYQQAALESDTEFFARMIIGVRGDRVTGIDNPLSDIQLMSLIAHYKNSNWEEQASQQDK